MLSFELWKMYDPNIFFFSFTHESIFLSTFLYREFGVSPPLTVKVMNSRTCSLLQHDLRAVSGKKTESTNLFDFSLLTHRGK